MLDFEHWKQVAPAEEVLERWKKLGMLEGLSEEQAKKCADYFEYMAIWILKNGEAVITDDKLYREPAITDDKLFGLVVFSAIKKIASPGFVSVDESIFSLDSSSINLAIGP